MKQRYQYCILLSIILSSCAVGPDFKQPMVPTVATYTSNSQSDMPKMHDQQIQKNQPVSATWWYAFGSPKLNQVIQHGIQHSYTLVSMEERLKEAQEMVKAANGGLIPQVGLQASGGHQKYGVALFGASHFSVQPFTYYMLGSNINWTLDIFGKTRRTIEQQQALMDYQQALLNAAFLSLTGNITTTALNIGTINAQIANTQVTIQDDQKNLALVQKAYQLGSATKLTLLTAETQLQNDATLLPPLKQQLSVAQGELTILVGAFPANWQPPQFTLHDFDLPAQLPLSLPSELVRARPDIQAAETLLHAACANVGIATANLYPQINLSANIIQEALSMGGLFDASSNAGGTLAGLTTPLFAGGTLISERRAAIAAYKAAYANYQQVVVQAFVQVGDVLYALKNDEEEVLMQKKAMLTAQASLNLSRLSYSAGSTDFLNIVESERFYNQTRFNYIKAQGQRYQDTAQLYLALGGGMAS